MPQIIIDQGKLVVADFGSKDSGFGGQIIKATVGRFAEQMDRKWIIILEPKFDRCFQYVRERIALTKSDGFAGSFGS